MTRTCVPLVVALEAGGRTTFLAAAEAVVRTLAIELETCFIIFFKIGRRIECKRCDYYLRKGLVQKLTDVVGEGSTKLFYKFLVSTDPIKFTKMKPIDDKDVETMAALYCGNRSNQNVPIQLFAKVAGVEPTEDPTPLGIDINLNVAPKTDVVGNDVYNSSDASDHEVDIDSDPNMDEVPNDIDDEGVNDDGNVNASSVEN
ncbi:hypothetical protein J1N35_011542 [Gossypium stocksii]|uniref:Uncharacterized protein n=1 Tax=Gossypium stocksii TaxID=47602 RepID=A0A9D4ADD7_9ROSI|nr:hypothetical protein J1N35_011542 [Gossypium stocksii]